MTRYYISIVHPSHEPRSEFGTSSPLAAWAALLVLQGRFPAAGLRISEFDASCAPPVRQLSENELMTIALQCPSGEYKNLGLNKERP